MMITNKKTPLDIEKGILLDLTIDSDCWKHRKIIRVSDDWGSFFMISLPGSGWLTMSQTEFMDVWLDNRVKIYDKGELIC